MGSKRRSSSLADSYRPSPDVPRRGSVGTGGASMTDKSSCMKLLPLTVVMLLNSGLNFTFYGTVTITKAFLTEDMNLSDTWATFFLGWILTTYFFMAIVGGITADAFFGKFWTIAAGSIVCLLGTLGLVISVGMEGLHKLSYVSLFLVAIGSGVTVPCFSSFLGDQMNEHDDSRKSSIFGYFYFSVQVGAVISLICSPILLHGVSKEGSFVFLCAGVVLTLPIFLACRGFYREVQGRERGRAHFYRLFWTLFAGVRFPCANIAFCNEQSMTQTKSYEEDLTVPLTEIEADTTYNLEEARNVRRAIVSFIPLMFFYGVYFQIFSVFPDTATRLNPYIGNARVPHEDVTALNGILDFLLIPFLSEIVYPGLAAAGYPLRPIGRMITGLCSAIVAVCCGAILEHEIQVHGENVLPIWWIVPQFFFISIAEVMLTITGLELAYSQAPPNVRAIVTSLYWLTLATGSQIQTGLAEKHFRHNYTVYIVSAVLLLVVLAVFAYITRDFEYRTPISSLMIGHEDDIKVKVTGISDSDDDFATPRAGGRSHRSVSASESFVTPRRGATPSHGLAVERSTTPKVSFSFDTKVTQALMDGDDGRFLPVKSGTSYTDSNGGDSGFVSARETISASDDGTDGTGTDEFQSLSDDD